jgi:hypothetical protein
VNRGWADLAAEIAAEFAELTPAWDDLADVAHRGRAKRLAEKVERTTTLRACGLCIHCGKPRGQDGTTLYCRRHANIASATRCGWARANRPKVNEIIKAARAREVAAGRCVQRCGRRTENGVRNCESCLAAARLRRKLAHQRAKGT